LDTAALVHDLAYRKLKDVPNRNKADKVLARKTRAFIKKAKYPSDVRIAILVWSIMECKVNNKV